MRIQSLLEKTLKNSILKRIRVKVDPRILVQQGYEYCPSFEGYILQECGNTTSVKVYLTNVPQGIDPIQTVNKKYISEIPKSASNLDDIKSKIIDFLIKNKNISQDDALIQRIKNTNDFDIIENALREKIDDKNLAELYKNIILHYK